jgi:predicted nucleic acid-binding protein
VIVVDTSVIVAYMNAADDHHATVAGWLDGADDVLATTPLIIAEVDHLVGARGGPTAWQALHRDLAAGAYLVEWWPGAMTAVVKTAERYADTGLGLAGASWSSAPGGSPRSRSRLSTSDTSASCDPWPAAGHSGSYRLICEPLALGRRSGTERISVPNPR